MDTSDVTASGCSRNTIAVKIYYPTRRPNEAKTNKLLKNEQGSKGLGVGGGRVREREEGEVTLVFITER